MNPNATWRVEFSYQTDAAAKRARRVPPLPVRGRILVTGGRRYVAFDANSLLDSLSEASQARPGRPV